MDDIWIKRAIVFTFCACLLMGVGVLLYGLFHEQVDNGEIFKMLGHDFDMILVALTGFLGGLSLGKREK